MEASTCSSCGTAFSCGASAASCWCQELPQLLPLEGEGACLCPRCLRSKLLADVEAFVARVVDGAEPNTAPRYQTAAAASRLVEDFDYYIENGAYVFTAWYHLKRGSCCGSGCRHCPYA